jgi:hypothetical protein
VDEALDLALQRQGLTLIRGQQAHGKDIHRAHINTRALALATVGIHLRHQKARRVFEMVGVAAALGST